MYQERARTFQNLQLFLDGLTVVLALGVALLIRVFHDAIPLLSRIPAEEWTARAVPAEYVLLGAVNVVVWIAYLRRSRLYGWHWKPGPAAVLMVYAKGLVLCALSTGAVMFALKIFVSRLLFGYFFMILAALLLIKQWIVSRLFDALLRDDSNRRHALVIGAPRPGAWFCRVVLQADRAGYELIGLLLDRIRDDEPDTDVPVLGTVADLDYVLSHHPVEEVFVVGSARELAELAPVAQDLIERGRHVSLVSTMVSGANGVRGRVTDFQGVPLLSFGPMPRDEVRGGLKRGIDVIVSSIALVIAAPLMGLIALAIKLSDRGPAVFSQERLGRGGSLFNVYKFRSMRTDAEQRLRSDPKLYARYVENDYKLPEREDPRILTLGRWLRKTSLDELPQLWNVLRGEMTLVGPRPIVPNELEMYRPYEALFLSVKPGLTGLWQVSGRSQVRYPERAFLELDYVGEHGVASDLSIIARTVPATLRGKGAH